MTNKITSGTGISSHTYGGPNTITTTPNSGIYTTGPVLTSPVLTGAGTWQTMGQTQPQLPPCKAFLVPRTSEDKFAEKLADIVHTDFDKVLSLTFTMKKNRETVSMSLHSNADVFAAIYQKLPSGNYYLTIEENLTTGLGCFSRTVEVLEIESMIRALDSAAFSARNQLDLVLVVKTVYVEITKNGNTEKILIS